MSNGLDRNVTVGAFDGSSRVIAMTDATQDLNDVQALFQSMCAQQAVAGGVATSTTKLRHAVSATPESPSGIETALAVTTSTGAFATQSLLILGTDYSVSGNVITWITDQHLATVIVTYHPKLDALVSDWRAMYPRQ